MTKPASKKSAKDRSKSEPIAERVEVPGARAAAFKLVAKAEGSFDLFRSGRKIGTARAEEAGGFSARFTAPDGEWTANAPTPSALLQLVGRYLLSLDARTAAAAAPAPKAGRTAEEKLSAAFVKKAGALRLRAIDMELTRLRRDMQSIRRAGR
jgi:hypothetical protein